MELTLSDQQVQVCFVRPEKVSPSKEAAYFALLDSQERERLARFRFPRDRWLFLVAHALVRDMLGRVLGCDPVSLQFTYGAYGRPALRTSEQCIFNLSHTRGLVACAVGSGCEIGIDVEGAKRKNNFAALARRFFAPEEVAAVLARSGEEQARCFLRIWTLKEAYVKARGAGLTIPLAKFSFPDMETPTPAVMIDPELEDEPARWRFVSGNPAPDHTYALAIGGQGGPKQCDIETFALTPLGSLRRAEFPLFPPTDHV